MIGNDDPNLIGLAMNGTPPELVGVWMHSHEEDTDSIMVFRPRQYTFPRTRGRDAMELRADGTCVWHGSGPDDRGRATLGHCENLGNAQVHIAIPAAGDRLVNHRVRSWTPDRLVLDK